MAGPDTDRDAPLIPMVVETWKGFKFMEVTRQRTRYAEKSWEMFLDANRRVDMACKPKPRPKPKPKPKPY